jgi:maleate isomerase
VPSGNSVAETELRAMLPEDVAIVTTRLALRGTSERALMAMLAELDSAAALLGHTETDLIAFNSGIASTVVPGLTGEIRNRISAATGRRTITCMDAVLAAFGALQARRVLLMTPYLEQVHRREVDFLEANGLTVSGGSYLGVDTNFGRIPPETIVAQVLAAASGTAADACFINCSAIRSAGSIAELETLLGMPVLTSNQVLAWNALRTLGMRKPVPGFGQILATPGA